MHYGAGVEFPSLVLPLIYDVSTNLTQLAEKRDAGPASAMAAASLQLKRFAEYPNMSECSVFPAVRDLLANLTLPSEQHQASPTPAQMHSPMPQQPVYPVGIPLGMMPPQ